MNEDRYYQGIKQVQILEDIGAVNEALGKGWRILRVPDASTQTMEPGGKACIVSKPIFVLGWNGPLKEDKPKVPVDIEWKAYSKGPGNWTFANTKGLEQLITLLRNAKDHTLIIGEWKYRLQGPNEDPERFVARYPHREKPA